MSIQKKRLLALTAVWLISTTVSAQETILPVDIQPVQASASGGGGIPLLPGSFDPLTAWLSSQQSEKNTMLDWFKEASKNKYDSRFELTGKTQRHTQLIESPFARQQEKTIEALLTEEEQSDSGSSLQTGLSRLDQGATPSTSQNAPDLPDIFHIQYMDENLQFNQAMTGNGESVDSSAQSDSADEQDSSVDSDIEESQVDATGSSDVVYTKEQASLTDWYVLGEQPLQRMTRTLFNYMPSTSTLVTSAVATAGIMYYYGMALPRKPVAISLLALAANYSLERLRLMQNPPEHFFSTHYQDSNQDTDLFVSYLTLQSIGTQKVSTDIHFGILFGDFCRRVMADASQYHGCTTHFFIGVTLAWIADKAFDTDSVLDSPSIYSKDILKAAFWSLRETARKQHPEVASSQVRDTSIHPSIHLLSKIFFSSQSIVLDPTTDEKVATEAISSLDDGTYYINNLSIVLLLDRTRRRHPITIFFPYNHLELYFDSYVQLARYLLVVSTKQVALVRGPFNEIALRVYFTDPADPEAALQEACGQFGFDPNHLPHKNRITQKYRELARNQHPSKSETDQEVAQEKYEQLGSNLMLIRKFSSLSKPARVTEQ